MRILNESVTGVSLAPKNVKYAKISFEQIAADPDLIFCAEDWDTKADLKHCAKHNGNKN